VWADFERVTLAPASSLFSRGMASVGEI
jgi:hypothetical protein